jgi:hypothetical protein
MFGIEESIGQGSSLRSPARLARRGEKEKRQKAAVLSSQGASRHMAAPSLGQDASLSFVVIGRGQGRLIRELEN